VGSSEASEPSSPPKEIVGSSEASEPSSPPKEIVGSSEASEPSSQFIKTITNLLLIGYGFLFVELY